VNTERAKRDAENAGHPPVSPRAQCRVRWRQHDARWDRLRVGRVDLTAEDQPGLDEPPAKGARNPPVDVVRADSDRVSALRTAKQEGVLSGACRGMAIHDEFLVAGGGASAGPEFQRNRPPAEPVATTVFAVSRVVFRPTGAFCDSLPSNNRPCPVLPVAEATLGPWSHQ